MIAVGAEAGLVVEAVALAANIEVGLAEVVQDNIGLLLGSAREAQP